MYVCKNAKAAVKAKPKLDEEENSADGDTSTGEDSGDDATSGGADMKSDGGDSNAADDEDMWDELQREARKESILETKSKETHPVHCPYFPIVSWKFCVDSVNVHLYSVQFRFHSEGTFTNVHITSINQSIN